jgi:hypothetical protein
MHAHTGCCGRVGLTHTYSSIVLELASVLQWVCAVAAVHLLVSCNDGFRACLLDGFAEIAATLCRHLLPELLAVSNLTLASLRRCFAVWHTTSSMRLLPGNVLPTVVRLLYTCTAEWLGSMYADWSWIFV